MKIVKEIQKLWERIFDSSNDNLKEPGFSYFAFISYTEQDEKWAEWLQWNLEHYKIPTKVRNEYRELPARIRPVFWYKNDLAGAHLSGAIKRELEQSKYMIVVCSPASAGKDWVNDEVRYFKEELGRGDMIIPFVVDGEINTDIPERECLPLPIRHLPREKELRCIDVRKYGKSKALVNIVSTLFDVRFDVLWNRFRRERQRKIAMYGVAFLLSAITLFGCWDYFLYTKYEYYVDIEDCNGIPTGIIRIDNDKAKEHYRLYRFEYRKHMLQRVVYVDGNGNPQEHTNTEFLERPCIQELSYGTDLLVVDCKNSTGRTLYKMHLSKDRLSADLKDEDENQAANFIFSSTAVDQGHSVAEQSSFLDNMLLSPSKIGRYMYERDSAGYVTKKMFGRHNGDNEDIGVDANGISGFEYERDSLHRIVRMYFLDSHGNYKSNRLGVAGKRYQYDSYGNLTVAEYVDKSGRLRYNELHWAKGVDKFDGNGYCLEESFYGPDGKPCVMASGFHKICISYDGRSETTSCYDIHGEPTYSLSMGNDPGGYSQLTTVRNEKGQVVEFQFKDANGNLFYNQYHVAILKIEYDEAGLVVGMRNYGTDQEPCTNVFGYFSERNSYNEQGNLLSQSFYNTSEIPAQNAFGVHRFSMKYDDTGQRLLEAHAYGSENLPMNYVQFGGAAWVKLGYDGRSRWVSSISFYNAENKPVETILGAKVSCDRNSYGQIESYRYYNSLNELSSTDTHSAIMKLKYNEMGMVTERRYLDENENSVMMNGFSSISIDYTSTGQPKTMCCYDTLQALKACNAGWAIQEFGYNNGAVSMIAYYGEDRMPVEIYGVHKYAYEYDDCGYKISESAFDNNNQPTVNSQVDAHKIVYFYDENKRQVGMELYDAVSDKPYVTIRLILNRNGLPSEQTAYNERGELVETPHNLGVAKITTEYDAQGRVLYSCATDKSGNKMNTTLGIAESRYFYGKNIDEILFLDSQQKLANSMGVPEPFAYSVVYMADNGQRLLCKTLRLSYSGEIETIIDACCYDSEDGSVLKVLHITDVEAQVYDAQKEQKFSYYSFDKEFDDYVQIVDSIQKEVELRYGKPNLYKEVAN